MHRPGPWLNRNRQPIVCGQRASWASCGHLAFVLTLIPILLTAMRVVAVANGDRATLVTLLSTIDVTSVLLGTFAWLLPSAFAAASAVCWIS